MIFDRQQQRLLLKGKEYTFEEISQLIAGGAEAHSPAYWDLYLFLNEWFNDSPVITVHTSGSTGIPKELMVRKDQMMQSARLTCEFLNLKKGESALLCMNLRYIGAMMVGRTFIGCRFESDCSSCFRSSVGGYKRTFEICGNGPIASL